MEQKDFNDWMDSISYSEWMEWAKKPSEASEDRTNVLLEIIDYLTKHPEDFNEPIQFIDGLPIAAPGASPRTWVSVSETLVDQCLENTFGKRFDSIVSIPKEELTRLLAGIIDPEIANKIADYVVQTKH